ncbi:DNA-methyltransferase [Hymenobacter caeli]|uniref:DNA modification methylase n=1 Tax=Hymenobacter caeli TaxID=2735894 RepID=A0ABX2FSD0_9BACT|nr:site-specific DNA-methyltransferase [Hymenobacter caeli]NRT19374.1 DNA modification methylase [Hymenobacter caeli]
MEKLGQWEVNKVHRADCLDAMRLMPNDCVDVIVTSPPYWGQRGDAGLGSEADPREYVKNLTTVLLEAMRVLKPEGVLWLNIGDSYNTPINWSLEDMKYSTLGIDGTGLAPHNSAYTKNRGSRRAFIEKQAGWLQYGNLLALPLRVIIALGDAGILYRGEVIWAKRKAMPEGRCRRPHRKHEPIYLFAKTERHAFTVQPPVPSVWDIKPDVNRTPHTSTFPLDLPVKCIQASGITSGIILDPFMGSGTTAVAAASLGFNYLGFELDPTRIDIIEQRIKAEAPALTAQIKQAEAPLTNAVAPTAPAEKKRRKSTKKATAEADLFSSLI